MVIRAVHEGPITIAVRLANHDPQRNLRAPVPVLAFFPDGLSDTILKIAAVP
jgi:hypothetical protein